MQMPFWAFIMRRPLRSYISPLAVLPSAICVSMPVASPKVYAFTVGSEISRYALYAAIRVPASALKKPTMPSFSASTYCVPVASMGWRLPFSSFDESLLAVFSVGFSS